MSLPGSPPAGFLGDSPPVLLVCLAPVKNLVIPKTTVAVAEFAICTRRLKEVCSAENGAPEGYPSSRWLVQQVVDDHWRVLQQPLLFFVRIFYPRQRPRKPAFSGPFFRRFFECLPVQIGVLF